MDVCPELPFDVRRHLLVKGPEWVDFTGYEPSRESPVTSSFAAGDTVRLIKDCEWYGKNGAFGWITLPAGTVLRLVPWPSERKKGPFYEQGFLCFEHPNSLGGVFYVHPTEIELCRDQDQDEVAPHLCRCSAAVLFAQGCQCGGV